MCVFLGNNENGWAVSISHFEMLGFGEENVVNIYFL